MCVETVGSFGSTLTKQVKLLIYEQAGWVGTKQFYNFFSMNILMELREMVKEKSILEYF